MIAAAIIVGAVLVITSEPKRRSERVARPGPALIEQSPRRTTASTAPGERRCA